MGLAVGNPHHRAAGREDTEPSLLTFLLEVAGLPTANDRRVELLALLTMSSPQPLASIYRAA
jgi:hypothetical protein